jgi:signal transduction histidine kinase/tetratricopeptide (TPR) repeat protein
MNRPFVVLLFYLSSLSTVFAQSNSAIDSLVIKTNRYSKEDTTKVSMLLNLSEKYADLNIEKAQTYANEALRIAEKTNAPKYIGKAYKQLGLIAQADSKYETSIELLNKAEIIFEKNNLKMELATVYLAMGSTYNFWGKVEKSATYFQKAYNLFESLGSQVNMAKAMGNMALAAMDASQYDQATQYIDKALAIFERLDLKQSLAVNYQNKALIYYYQSNYPLAIECFHKSLRICEQINNKKLLANNYSNLGVIYFILKDYEKEIEYDQKALKIFEEIGYNYGKIRALGNIAGAYSELHNYDKALDYHRKALEAAIKNKDRHSEGLENHGVGEILVKQKKNYDEALKYVHKSVDIANELDDKELKMFSQALTGNIYAYAPDKVLEMEHINTVERIPKAIALLQNALKISREIPVKEIELEILNDLSKIHETQGNFTEAYQYFKAYIAINDSIANDAVKKQIIRKDIQYEFDKKETELNFKQKMTTEELEKQRLITSKQHSELLLQQQNLQLKDQALLLSKKEKDLQKLAYLKEKAEKQEKETELIIAKKNQSLKESQVLSLIKEKALQVQILAKKNALIGFLVACLLGLFLAALAYYYWQRQKKLNQEKLNSMNFTKQLLEKTEDERRRIASDLHDSISHELLTLKSVFHQDIGLVNKKIDSIINDVRTISRNLHPVMFDKIGLLPNIEQMVERLQAQYHILITTELVYNNTLSSAEELQIYRIIQEALTNIVKYADAEAAKISIIQTQNTIEIEIKDNGKGFNVTETLNSGHAFGLHNIIERSRAIGGETLIKSDLKGTIIKINIPKKA